MAPTGTSPMGACIHSQFLGGFLAGTRSRDELAAFFAVCFLARADAWTSGVRGPDAVRTDPAQCMRPFHRNFRAFSDPDAGVGRKRRRALLSGRIIRPTVSRFVALVAVWLASCGPSESSTPGMKLESAAFPPGAAIPKEHARDGRDASPPLSWSGLPDGTESVALICEDPDAPMDEPWVHWVIWNLPPGAGVLAAGVPKEPEAGGARQGLNDFGKIGYGGPEPPQGDPPHRYHFRLYALSGPLDLEPGATKEELLDAMQGKILGRTVLVGTYAEPAAK